MWEIMHAHTCDPNRNVYGLKTGGDIEHGIHLGAGVGHASGHGATARYAARGRDLRDHGVSRGILEDQVIILVAFQLDHGQSRIHDPDRRLLRGNTIVGGDGRRRRKGSQVGYGCTLWSIEVDQADIGIGSYFHGLAFHAAGKSESGWKNQGDCDDGKYKTTKT